MIFWLPLSLFPIPRPTPTVERLIVEVNNAASGSGWVTPVVALVTAVVAAALTHSWTRNRDHTTWQREQLFEVSRVLAANEKVITEECSAAPNPPRYTGARSVSYYQRILDDHDWTALNKATEAYRSAVIEGTLLLRTKRFQDLLTEVQNELDSATYQTQKLAPEHGFRGRMVTWEAFRDRQWDQLRQFTLRHKELMDLIAGTYFLPRNELSPRWWRHPIRTNRERREHRRTASTALR